ncbi:NAD-dependent succinate-semialdehyde dehydrogenase [Sphingomonas sp. MMS24-J13]|uniref:NAD-dependent succinate-semialdehyde dehydrogenase n=1 Tax=Sphingomonas sp. MMS24-J13 TaxID=3238686 RepID=UPI00384DDEBE
MSDLMGDGGPGLALARPGLFRESAFVGGEWVTGNAVLGVVNPATGETIGTIPDLGTAEAEAAVAAAQAALPGWRAQPAGARAAILRRWNDLILAHADDLARLMTIEQGKPLAEARGEVAYAASFIGWFAEEARRSYGDIIPGHAADKRLAVTREPVGVVAAITPWNFPLAMITRKAGPALAAGCTMVLKPSELTPFSALALAVLAEEAGVPAGVLNVVTGRPQEIGAVLTGDVRVRKFSFTGSTAVGKMLAARCMATVKRVSLELGGNAPLLVFDDADLDVAVDGAIISKYRNAGQTCVCANRIYVQAGIHDAFVERLQARVASMRVGDGLADGVTMGPLIDDRAIAKAQAHVDDAVARGAKLLAGGERLPSPGNFFAPTILRDVPADALLCREETFAPVAGIVRFEREAEAIAFANDTAAGLAAYVFTRDLSRSHRVAEALEYGMVGMNTGLISTEVAPFGGIKESGFGREGSRYGMDEYLNMKLVVTAVTAA